MPSSDWGWVAANFAAHPHSPWLTVFGTLNSCVNTKCGPMLSAFKGTGACYLKGTGVCSILRWILAGICGVSWISMIIKLHSCMFVDENICANGLIRKVCKPNSCPTVLKFHRKGKNLGTSNDFTLTQKFGLQIIYYVLRLKHIYATQLIQWMVGLLQHLIRRVEHNPYSSNSVQWT